MPFLANLDKSTYLSNGNITSGTIRGSIVDEPQLALPVATAIKTSEIITYLLPSAITFGVIYILVCDGKMR